MSSEMNSLPIGTTVTFLKSIPAEVKTWRMVPQLIFQLVQVIKVCGTCSSLSGWRRLSSAQRLCAQCSQHTDQLVALRTSIFSCVLELLKGSRFEDEDRWHLFELVVRGTRLVR